MDKILIKNGIVSNGSQLVHKDVEILNSKIIAISPNMVPTDHHIIDARHMTVLPGFIDTHTHGGNNYDINNSTMDDLKELCKFYARHGVTGVYPTILTDTKERLLECVGCVGVAMKTVQTGSSILGIHLEGPYLAKEYRGAMPEDLLQLPSVADFEEYQRASGNAIKIMTIAPEIEGIIDFVAKISKMGVLISIGHSGADYETAWESIRNGANCSTHTFNVMKLSHQHFPEITGAVMESDIYCEIICDGIHVHPAMIRILLKTKGWDKVVSITDSISAAGLPDGKYTLGVNDIEVVDGDAKIANTDCRAGSTLTADRSFRNLLEFTKADVPSVSKLMSENQAKMMGIFDVKGSIDIGKDGDIVILDAKHRVAYTIVEGLVKYQA